MAKISTNKILVVLLVICIFLLYRNIGFAQRSPEQLAKDINLLYGEAMSFYLQGEYQKAEDDLESVIAIFNSYPAVEDWLTQNRAKPSRQEVQERIQQIKVEVERKSQQERANIAKVQKLLAQEKALVDLTDKKQKNEKGKIKQINELLLEAKKLYTARMYKESMIYFNKVIELEGDPRKRASNEAKDYIEKAQDALDQQQETKYTDDVDSLEKDMINNVMKNQLPVHIEPPKIYEKEGPIALVEPSAIRKKLKETRITMDFDKVSLKSVISFLSQESGVNFVASQKVTELAPILTARFKDTTLDEVIKYITKSLGLVYRIDKEVVWIAHPEEIANESMETRVYYLNKGGGLFTEFTAIAGGSTDSGLGSSSAQISKIYTIEDTLKEVVPWPSDAKLTYDKRLNALIVRNTPQNLQTLEDVIYNLDITPYQILIEAKFMEVDVTNTKELGVEWEYQNKHVIVGDTTGLAAGISKGIGVVTDFSKATEGLNLAYKGVLTAAQYASVLHALEESKKIKTLSSPRITTLNNQIATMKVVDEWIYPTRYEYEILQVDLNGDGDYSDPGETTYKNVPKDFVRRDVGILLKVIPSVGSDRKSISLSLIPEVSEATADAFVYTGGVSMPKFTSRNLSTTVVVNSGDTVVLGGMIKESRSKTVIKTPLLGDIPFFGYLFKKVSDSVERKNLLIFVTAKLLSPSGEEVVIQP